jgi:Phytanoyl-CoA dioxygenase (PhyH)
MIFLDQDQEKSFQANGFLKLEMFNSDELSSLEVFLNSLAPKDHFDPIQPPGFHCTSLSDDVAYKTSALSGLKIIFEKKCYAILDDYRFLTGNIYTKPAGKGEVVIHQNWPTTRDLKDTTISIWAPLADTNELNGTLHVIPGSHKLLDYIEEMNVPSYVDSFSKELLDGDYFESQEIRRGEALIFCDSLLHYSPKNSSDLNRVVFHAEMVPKHSETVVYKFRPENPHQFEVYEAGMDFYMNHSVLTLLEEPPLKKLEIINNPNKQISFVDFTKMLKKRKERKGLLKWWTDFFK